MLNSGFQEKVDKTILKKNSQLKTRKLSGFEICVKKISRADLRRIPLTRKECLCINKIIQKQSV
jgi:hypothetical protein